MVVAPGAPIQLVRVARKGENWHFELNEEAAAILAGLQTRHVRVSTVCGPYRSGKSYLLNLLLGREPGTEKFCVGSTVRACTEGIWMWGAGEGRGGSSEDAVLFWDCEGFGNTESDRTRDAKLMALCFLLSSVFLLNTKGVLSEGLFNTLSLISNLAQHFQQVGQEVTKPALLWLLRDFCLDLHDTSGNPITSDEYLEQALRQQPLAGVDAARSQAAREVRETLLKFFPERHCATLVQPVIEEAALRKLADVPFSELRPEFQRQLGAMQTQLTRLARTYPKAINGIPVGGVALAAMLRTLIDALNSDQSMNFQNAWVSAQHSACHTLREEMREKVEAKVRNIVEGGSLSYAGHALPIVDETLAKVLKEERRTIREEWRSRAIVDGTLSNEYWKELREDIAHEEQVLHRHNKKLAEIQLHAAVEKWGAWLNDDRPKSESDQSRALIRLIEQGLPYEPTARAACEALERARQAYLRQDAKLSALEAQLEENEPKPKCGAFITALLRRPPASKTRA